jgi:iron complex transport system substrate-binding protein
MSCAPGRITTLLALAVLSVGSWCGCRPNDGTAHAPAPRLPVRIVSLTLATDEMLSELVSPERLAGITKLADDPGVSNVAGHYPESIARIREATPERIIALAPDLVCVAPYNSADTLELLRRSGLSIYRNEAVHRIDQIEVGLEKLGERVGEAKRGRELAQRMKDRRRRLSERLRDLAKRPRVLFWSAGFTSGRDSTIDDIIREGGGRNVATELGLDGSAEIAPERVVAADPDYVLLSRWKDDDRQGQIANHPILRELRAVREARVIAIDCRYLTSVSQFVVDGAERLAVALHPDSFAGEVLP